MDHFDFFSRFSLGQYIGTRSFVHRVDPRSKILSFTILVLSLTFSKNLLGILFAILFTLLLLLASKVSLKDVLRGIITPLPIVLILAILQVFITPHSTDSSPLLSFGIFSIYQTGIQSGVMLLVRFTGLILLLTLAGSTLSTLELIYGLNLLLRPLQIIGLPIHSIVMVVQIMVRFIPFLLINAERIAKSQASRGAGWDDPKGGILKRVRQFIPVIIPLFSTSIQQAENLAYAMVARGYQSNAKRTGYLEYDLKIEDFVFFIICVFAAYTFLFVLKK